MGILANHVPSIEALCPGLIEVVESGNASKKWFGAAPLESFSSEEAGKVPEPIYAADDQNSPETPDTDVGTGTDC
ncbi:hypothetical protein EV424DRAFT_1546334 [Suillus variegatus]|nr:hypothetical protein EV424DRAFT_1546334 [Suillus variegatus]